MTINGKQIAADIIAELKKQPKPKKILAAFLVGENPASLSFLKQKEKVAKELDVDFRIYRRPTSINNEELRTDILKIANNQTCGGVILQLPLPEHVNRDEIIGAIPPEKDVDNLTGRAPVLSPAVGVVEEIIRNLKLEIRNYSVAVVGLGFLVGGPVSRWLKGKCAKLYLLDIGDDLEILKQADLVVSGVGRDGLIKADMLKDNAVVIDFGGDFDVSSSLSSSLSYTPTPGGTGPILVAKLFENFYKLNS